MRTIDSILKNQATLEVAPPGKFRIVGEDRWDHSRFAAGDYDTAAEALSKARAYTLEAANGATDPSIADGYEVYDDQGRYFGGEQPRSDWWEAKSLKASVADQEAAVAEHFDLLPLLSRGANALVNAGDFERASAVCREAAASLGCQISAVHHFGGADQHLQLTHLIRCRTGGGPTVDVEFRMADHLGRIDWVEIQAFTLLQGAPEPLLEKLTAIVGDAKKLLETSKS